MRLIQYETRAGDPVISGETKIIPFSRALNIKLPGLHGGVIWNRPVAVLIQTAEGEEDLLLIRDVTRQVQWRLVAGSILVLLLTWFLVRKRK
jgi:hypothetical protein